MPWKIEFSETALSQLRKLDKPTAYRIIGYMNERVAELTDPRSLGKSLTGPLGRLWRFRIGDYRLICDIQTAVLRVLVIRIGKRDQIYRR